MGQMATQPQHYIGHLGQPGQPFSASPQVREPEKGVELTEPFGIVFSQMIQANQQMFYLQQGTVPNFVPTQQGELSHADLTCLHDAAPPLSDASTIPYVTSQVTMFRLRSDTQYCTWSNVPFSFFSH